MRIWNLVGGRAKLSRLWAVIGLVLISLTEATHAKPASLDIVPLKQLRFGSFGVMTTGSRVVSPAGTVTSSGLIPVQGSLTGPAEFTIVYDRGNESKRPLNLVIEVALLAAPPLRQGGMVAMVSDYTTDLANGASLSPGQPVLIAIDNCLTRQCSYSFRVGGRLQVQRSAGGGPISIAIPITANVISVDGKRP